MQLVIGWVTVANFFPYWNQIVEVLRCAAVGVVAEKETSGALRCATSEFPERKSP
jgi:hypothetical protein